MARKSRSPRLLHAAALAAIVGFIALVVGVYTFSPGAALIVAGAILLIVGLTADVGDDDEAGR